jgi:hypothetical protein
MINCINVAERLKKEEKEFSILFNISMMILAKNRPMGRKGSLDMMSADVNRLGEGKVDIETHFEGSFSVKRS